MYRGKNFLRIVRENYRFASENVVKQLVHASAVRLFRREAFGKFGEHSGRNSYASFMLSKFPRKNKMKINHFI